MSTLQYIRVPYTHYYYNCSTCWQETYQQFITSFPSIASNPLSYFFFFTPVSQVIALPTHLQPIQSPISQPSQSQTIPYQPNPSGNVHTRTVDRRPASHLSTGSPPPPPPYLNSQSLKKKRRDPINRHSYLPYLSIFPGRKRREKKAQTLKVLEYITIKPPHRRSSNL